MQYPLFVYGSLKHGQVNHCFIDGPFIKNTILHDYVLYDVGLPIVIKGQGKVIGELYNQEDLDGIDRLEGHPYLYKREVVNTEDGPAFCYIFQIDSNSIKLNKNRMREWW